MESEAGQEKKKPRGWAGKAPGLGHRRPGEVSALTSRFAISASGFD